MYQLTFGKYAGATLIEVYELNKVYIEFLKSMTNDKDIVAAIKELEFDLVASKLALDIFNSENKTTINTTEGVYMTHIPETKELLITAPGFCMKEPYEVSRIENFLKDAFENYSESTLNGVKLYSIYLNVLAEISYKN